MHHTELHRTWPLDEEAKEQKSEVVPFMLTILVLVGQSGSQILEKKPSEPRPGSEYLLRLDHASSSTSRAATLRLFHLPNARHSGAGNGA